MKTYDQWEKAQGISPSSPEAYYAEEAWKARQVEIDALTAKLDKLLDHCGDPECMVCGAIICPFGEPLHFHHDGCPCCAQEG